VASELTRLLFVYGTLQRGGIWHHPIARETFIGRDIVTGALYLHPCGAYPVLLPGDRAVPGEVFRVGPAAFERVARLEADEYTPCDVMTGSGRSVTVFVCEDERFRTPSRALQSFDPRRYLGLGHDHRDRDGKRAVRSVLNRTPGVQGRYA
jgi:gamma-glutamylcyclotransferase (GGCT)/AIG2-like uncharacterized protein YtfP